MRAIVFLALAVLAAPAGAQWVDVAPGAGPNARAAHRPLGPNARAAQRPVGPNGAIARARTRDGEARYATCGEARSVRATPVYRGEAGYSRHLDHDGDGRACEEAVEGR